MAVEEMQNAPAARNARRWENDPVLTVEHLTMRFGGLVAVNDLSFDVGRGDITALIGPNGAGKTTVFNCVTGFYKPTEGRIVMRHGAGQQDERVRRATLGPKQYLREDDGSIFLLERMPDFVISDKAKVARTFQNIRLFGGMTVLENLLIAQHNSLMLASWFTFGGILGMPTYKKAEKKAIELAKYWLEQVSLTDRADDPAADLPYGAQRRLEIARAMCTGPRLLCLDEPAAGLNPRESHQLNELLQFIRAEHDTSVLLIEHDMGVVMEISDHVIVLDYGVKISDGAAADVRTDPKVIAAYLGVEDEAEIDVPMVKEDLARAGGGKPPSGRIAKSPRRTKEPAAKSPPAKPARRPAAKAEKSVAPQRAGDSKRKAGAHPGEQPAGIRKARAEGADNLTRIQGIGPASERKLNEIGIWHFDQIGAWRKKEVQWIGSYLAFPGRIEREEWVKQAKTLARDRKLIGAKSAGKSDKAKAPASRAARKPGRGKGGKA